MSLDLQYAVLALVGVVVFGGLYLRLRREGKSIDAEQRAALHHRMAGESLPLPPGSIE